MFFLDVKTNQPIGYKRARTFLKRYYKEGLKNYAERQPWKGKVKLP